MIARPAGSGEAYRSSEGGTRSVRGAGRLPGSPRSPRVALSLEIYISLTIAKS